MRNAAWIVIASVLVASACGGGGAATGDPKTSSDAKKASTDATNDTSGDDGPPSGPRKPSCSDGSCTTCGDGICPTGFYCETAHGNTGCAWASSCTGAPTCACLGAAVKGCDCQDDGGIARVTCR